MNPHYKTKKTMRLYSISTFVLVFFAVSALVFIFGAVRIAYASDAALYENPNTGEIFLKPGQGRVKVGQGVINQLLKQNTKKTARQINNIKAREKKLETSLKTVKGKTLPSWTKHVSLGALVYMGYGYYTQTGLTEGSMQLEENPPATGNNGYNAFNVNRAYLIFLYHQDNWFLKVTPNFFKSNNSGATGGNEYFRLKYAFLQFNHVYDANGLTVNLKAGQFPTPMVAWEDGLLGYHVAERTPWGFLNVTSTQAGLGVSGKYRSNGKIYMAYNAGFFDNAAFHADETVDQKSPQARLTFYPMGADSGLNGLSISGYYAWAQDGGGFGNAVAGSGNHPETRISGVLDYKTPNANIALQYDYAINHTVNPGAGQSSDEYSYCGIEKNIYGCYTSATEPSVTSVYNNNNIASHGYDAFGYYNIPNSKFGLFGLIQRYYYATANYNAAGQGLPSGNPFDFQRTVAGIAYHLNSHITLTADWQNFQYLYAKDYKSLPSSNPNYLDFGQWMGQTNAYFIQARIAF